MSFRQFGGLNFAARNNIVASNYNTSNNLQVTQNVGQPNSYMNFLSDISANNILTHTLICSNNASIYGNLTVSGNTISSNNLTVLGSTDLKGNVGIGKAPSSYALDISGNSNVEGNQNVSGNITVKSNETIGGALQVTTTSTLSGNVGIGKAPSSYALDISGNSNINGVLNITSYPTYSGSLTPTASNQFITKAYGDSTYGLIASNNKWTGTNAFNTYLPTSTVTPTASNQFITKAYGDSTYLTSSLLSNNNTWTGTNAFNTSLPTSTITPTASNQFITKAYGDSTYVGSSLLSSNNTWTGTNSFSKNVGIGKASSTAYALDISGNCNVNNILSLTNLLTFTGNNASTVMDANNIYTLNMSCSTLVAGTSNYPITGMTPYIYLGTPSSFIFNDSITNNFYFANFDPSSPVKFSFGYLLPGPTSYNYNEKAYIDNLGNLSMVNGSFSKYPTYTGSLTPYCIKSVYHKSVW